MALAESDRLREEDPYTAAWTEVAPTHVVALRSRFEVDLNRPREKAVYRKPEDAWGLRIWKEAPGHAHVEQSLAEYDAFYRELRSIFRAAEERHGAFVVFDIHTYNHRRNGPGGEPESPESNPEVNVGTGTMVRERWAPLVDGFIDDLGGFDFAGRHLDVRENVRFRGGWMSQWTHENFPNTGCVLAIEFRKFFMNEWTGELYTREHQLILEALRSTVPGVLGRAKTLAGS
jgi:N-formylglutamate amidohydrolase